MTAVLIIQVTLLSNAIPMAFTADSDTALAEIPRFLAYALKFATSDTAPAQLVTVDHIFVFIDRSRGFHNGVLRIPAAVDSSLQHSKWIPTRRRSRR